MRALGRALGSGIGIAVLAALAASLAVWFLGPFLGVGGAVPFASVLGRAIGIAALWLVALVAILLVVMRRARRDRALADGIAEAPPAPEEAGAGAALVAGELSEMRTKLREALGTLRRSKLGRRSLYELPWYVVIGPPGAGKTTAIVNSGLRFPLAGETDAKAVGGVGGTRNCDWWFTEDAVLIDTAGRYTTNESDAAADAAGWLGFLDLLKKHRRRQPINGAIVAISLADLAMQDETTQAAHAAAVRRRLNELRERLGVRFPVYVVFTKADLVAGFTEFHDALGKEGRGQVWGFTLPLPGQAEAGAPSDAFDAEFDALLDRLNAQSLERVQQETDPGRRALVAGFPNQVAATRPMARAFLAEVFQGSRYEDRHLLRGVYFASGTQEGAPIDRLMLGMARTFGIGRQAIGTGRGTGRSYFLTRLFTDVIFPEAGLVSADDRVERRYRWTRRAALAAAILLALGAAWAWTGSYLGNRALLAEASDRLGAYREAAARLPAGPIADSDLPAVVPALDVLRGLPGNPVLGEAGPDRALTYGLYQGDVVGTQAAQTYRAALNQHFLPRLLLRLEEQMQANVNNPDLLYEALKIYLMLGLQGPMNRDLVAEWMELDWSLAYAGPARADLRAALGAHLDALLSAPITPVELNGPLVEQVQGVLAQMPLTQRVYSGIVSAPAAAALPDWRLSDVGGPSIARAMTRSSGKSLEDGIEGIYTRRGFHDVFLEEALAVAERLQRESWVLGPRGEAEATPQALALMSRDVLDLYYDDYVEAYDGILGDLDVVPFESPSHAAEITNVLSGPTSPIVNVLEAVAEETRLAARAAPEISTEGLAGAAEGEAIRQVSGRSQRLIAALRAAAPAGAQTGAPPAQPGAYVEERFARLHALVDDADGQGSRLGRLIALMSEVYQELNRIAMTGGTGATAQSASAIQRLQQAAAEVQDPVQRWATQIASGSTGITRDGTRSSIDAAWQSEVLPFCRQALEGRYPFDRRARADVGLADFARLFGPGGLIDAFFQEHLAQHVDTTARPWRFRPVNGVDLGISDAVLVQFQNAAQIRQAFFAGGPTPAIRFQVTPEALDPKAQTVTLEVDGTELVFGHTGSAPRPTAFAWPGPVGNARVIFRPVLDGAGNALVREGPWAWFRLLDAAEIRQTNVSDRKRVIFNVGGRIAIFRLQSGSVLNPFALPALAKFACPTSF